MKDPGPACLMSETKPAARTRTGLPGVRPPTRLTFAEAQARAWANKQSRGFNTTNIDREFCLLIAEIGEAYDAWRKTTRRPPWYRRILAVLRLWPLPAPKPHRSVCLEIADVHIFTLGLAQMLGIDSAEAVTEKLAINEARQYQRLPGGTHVRVPSEAGQAHPAPGRVAARASDFTGRPS